MPCICLAVVSLQDKVTLRRPCVLIKKLPIKSPYIDHWSSSDSAAVTRPSYANHRNSSDSASDRRPAYTNHRNTSNNAFISSDSETTQSEIGADHDSDFRDWEKCEQHYEKNSKEPCTSENPSKSLCGFETPDQVPTMADRLDPKEARVMASIARKKRFLTGSPATSSDDSSCSFLKLRKTRQVKLAKLARHFPQSLVSPEIPLATCGPASHVNLSSTSADAARIVPPVSSPPTIGGTRVDGRGNVPHVVVDLLGKIKPDFLQPLQQPLDKHWTRGKSRGDRDAMIPASVASSERVSEHTASVTNGDVGMQSIARRVLHTRRRRVVKKRTMAAVKQDCDFVSDTDSESPLNKKSGPLHGLNGTLRKTH